MPKGSNLTCPSTFIMGFHEKSCLGLMQRGRPQAFGLVQRRYRSFLAHIWSEERPMLSMDPCRFIYVLYSCKDSKGDLHHLL